MIETQRDVRLAKNAIEPTDPFKVWKVHPTWKVHLRGTSIVVCTVLPWKE